MQLQYFHPLGKVAIGRQGLQVSKLFSSHVKCLIITFYLYTMLCRYLLQGVNLYLNSLHLCFQAQTSPFFFFMNLLFLLFFSLLLGQADDKRKSNGKKKIQLYLATFIGSSKIDMSKSQTKCGRREHTYQQKCSSPGPSLWCFLFCQIGFFIRLFFNSSTIPVQLS